MSHLLVDSIESAAAFLDFLWSSNYVEFEEKRETRGIDRKTKLAMQFVFVGHASCETSGGDRRWCSGVIEGHHTKNGNMSISTDRHCKTQKLRQRTIRKLYKKVKNYIVYLC